MIQMCRASPCDSGALRLPLSTYDFSYTAEDGTLAIDFADPAASDAVYSYTVKGKTLTLDNGSMTFTLEKQKSTDM